MPGPEGPSPVRRHRTLTVGLFLQAVEGDCEAHVLKQANQFSVLFVKCDSTPGTDDPFSSSVCPCRRSGEGIPTVLSLSSSSDCR